MHPHSEVSRPDASPDASKVVCRVCGEFRQLGTEARAAATELATFTAAHSVHDRFRIDVVTGRVTEGQVWRLPLQRDDEPVESGVRSA
jgi:hypothetical protein